MYVEAPATSSHDEQEPVPSRRAIQPMMASRPLPGRQRGVALWTRLRMVAIGGPALHEAVATAWRWCGCRPGEAGTDPHGPADDRLGDTTGG